MDQISWRSKSAANQHLPKMAKKMGCASQEQIKQQLCHLKWEQLCFHNFPDVERLHATNMFGIGLYMREGRVRGDIKEKFLPLRVVRPKKL